MITCCVFVKLICPFLCNDQVLNDSGLYYVGCNIRDFDQIAKNALTVIQTTTAFPIVKFKSQYTL